MAKLVAADVIAHRFEFAPLAAADGLSADGDERLRTERFELHLAGAAHIWVNLYPDGLAAVGLAPDEPPRREITHRRPAKFIAATPHGPDAVDELRTRPGLDGELGLAVVEELHLVRVLVLDAEAKSVGRFVLDLEMNVERVADRSSGVETARDRQALDAAAAHAVIPHGRRYQQDVIRQHRPPEGGEVPRKRKRNQPDRKQDVKFAGENEKHCF